MKNATRRINWNEEAEKAQRMSSEMLHYAILDIRATLPFADSMDRTDGDDRGGFYRDVLSVYVKELKSRGDN
jgi:hypothetical protein